MKKLQLLLLIPMFLLGICSCDDNDTKSNPEVDENRELIFEQQGGIQTLSLKGNPRTVTLIVDDAAKEWCAAEYVNDKINISIAYNTSPQDRKTDISIVSDNNTSVITVAQQGVDISIGSDQKLKISGGEASSAETTNDETGFEKSYDGNPATFWHTGWSDKAPFTATYNLQDAEQLDYIMYYPRTPNGGNGNFGEVEIYVSTEAVPAFTKVMTYNHDKKGNSAKIKLPASVLKPKAVKFNILSGANGNASCSEMEFYAVKEGAVKTKDIPLGGNSYVTTSGAAGLGYITDNGFSSWTSPNTVFSTFFRVNKSGDLKMYLTYRADSDGNVIEATCKGEKFQVTLPKPKTKIDTTVFLGVIQKVDPGYVQVDFKGVTLKGTVFASATNLLVGGTSTEDMNYVGDFSYYWGRRGPSIHMGYAIPSGHTAEWFYNEVTVPVGLDPIGSYFMANGFGQGYFGMQVNSATERRVLFSVWSPYETDDPSTIPDEDRVKLIRKGEGVTINDFGNEGSGGQSYLKYNWVAGNTYKFLNRVRPIENGYSEYTAYFYAPESGKWRLIAQWKRPKIQTYYTNAHSFLENFNNNKGHLTRKANYANQWVYTKAGQWVELTSGKFTVDETGRDGWRMDYKGGLEGSGFFLQNCGFFDETVQVNSTFERKAGGVQPVIDWSGLE